MAIINMASIMNKVEAFARSAGGKQRMQKCIQNYTKEGKGQTEAGDKVLTKRAMEDAALKFIEGLQSIAQGHNLPASVMEHFSSLRFSPAVEEQDGSAIIYIYFGGDLERESLYEGGYKGVDNIIAVLNCGYKAKNYVYGWWDGHRPTGDNIYRSGNIENSAFIRSKKDRMGLGFIQQAVSDFNNSYGKEYNVTAEAGDEYCSGKSPNKGGGK